MTQSTYELPVYIERFIEFQEINKNIGKEIK